MPASPPPPTFRGCSVTVSCSDLRRSERFYVETLGAEALPGDGYGCRFYRLGALTISLMPNATRPSPSTFPEHAMALLWLEVDDIDAAHRRLREANCTVLQAPDDGMMMLVADPDGLVLEIWQHDADSGAPEAR